MVDYRPQWVRDWEKDLLAARQGDTQAHKRLEVQYPQLPTGTAYRSNDRRTCEYCGLKH